jgi:hypothetical protein
VTALEYLRATLDRLPPEVRHDFGRIALAAMDRVEERWTGRRGIEMRWYVLGRAVPPAVRVEEVAPGDLGGYSMDDIGPPGFDRAALAKLGDDDRACALVYGSGFRSFRFKWSPTRDTFMRLNLAHWLGSVAEIDLRFERVSRGEVRFGEDLRRQFS